MCILSIAVITLSLDGNRIENEEKRQIVRKRVHERDRRDRECARVREWHCWYEQEAWRASNLSNYRTITLSN